jgi:hypothetical protein
MQKGQSSGALKTPVSLQTILIIGLMYQSRLNTIPSSQP